MNGAQLRTETDPQLTLAAIEQELLSASRIIASVSTLAQNVAAAFTSAKQRFTDKTFAALIDGALTDDSEDTKLLNTARHYCFDLAVYYAHRWKALTSLVRDSSGMEAYLRSTPIDEENFPEHLHVKPLSTRHEIIESFSTVTFALAKIDSVKDNYQAVIFHSRTVRSTLEDAAEQADRSHGGNRYLRPVMPRVGSRTPRKHL